MLTLFLWTLGSYTAFDILNSLPEHKRPHPIFVTAHEQFAVQSYRYYAIDYLMKPVSIADLEAVFRKLEIIYPNNSSAVPANEPYKSKDVLVISDRSTWRFLNINDVVVFKGSGSYTQISMDDGSEYTVSKAIGYYEDFLLHNTKFLKVHRSFIVNISKIKSFEKSDRTLTLQNGQSVPVAIRPEVLLEMCFG